MGEEACLFLFITVSIMSCLSLLYFIVFMKSVLIVCSNVSTILAVSVSCSSSIMLSIMSLITFCSCSRTVCVMKFIVFSVRFTSTFFGESVLFAVGVFCVVGDVFCSGSIGVGAVCNG